MNTLLGNNNAVARLKTINNAFYFYFFSTFNFEITMADIRKNRIGHNGRILICIIMKQHVKVILFYFIYEISTVER